MCDFLSHSSYGEERFKRLYIFLIFAMYSSNIFRLLKPEVKICLKPLKMKTEKL